MKNFLSILLALACYQIVQAQEYYLLYKEYDPDNWTVLGVDQHYDIDINEDSIPDIVYSTFDGGSGSVYIASYAYAGNGWAACNHCIEYSGYNNIFYDLSTPLNDSTLVFGGRCLAEYYTYGQVPPLFYKVGLKHCEGGNCYYGWAEFEEDRQGSVKALFHVSRTCYCSIPNYPLRWGQTSLTDDLTENESVAFATLHPNPTTGLVTITGEDLRQAEVFNALGQRVAMVRNESGQMTVDVSGLPAGLYFVNITDEEGRKCVRKVVKK